MNPASEPIPGLRRPDAREQAWIAEHWGREIEQLTFRKNGRFLRFIGIFLAAMSGVGIARRDDNLAGMVITLILAAICFALSHILEKGKGTKDRRLQALATGDYYVAQAVSVRLGHSKYEGKRRGFAQVRLSDGRVLEGTHWMPYRLAQPYIEQKIHNIPILVIQLPGEDRIFTIPAPR